MQQPAQHLLAIELLAPPVLLHHHVRNLVDALIRREALVAALALAPPANRVRLFALARIHHAVLRKPAVRTLHRNASILAARITSPLLCDARINTDPGSRIIAILASVLNPHLLLIRVIRAHPCRLHPPNLRVFPAASLSLATCFSLTCSTRAYISPGGTSTARSPPAASPTRRRRLNRRAVQGMHHRSQAQSA